MSFAMVIAESLFVLASWQDAPLQIKSHLIRHSNLGNLEKAEKLYCLIEVGMRRSQLDIILGEDCETWGFGTGYGPILPTTNFRIVVPYPMIITTDIMGNVTEKRLRVVRGPDGKLHQTK